jgi:hypothetical protein
MCASQWEFSKPKGGMKVKPGGVVDHCARSAREDGAGRALLQRGARHYSGPHSRGVVRGAPRAHTLVPERW